jgi:hypothetical protein
MRARIQKIDGKWVTTFFKYNRCWVFKNSNWTDSVAELPFLFIVLKFE